MRLLKMKRLSGRAKWVRNLATAGGICLSVGLLNLAGCPQPTYPQMYPGVTLTQVKAVTEDPALTKAEKKQALTDLGITDEQMHTMLVGAYPAPATQPGA